MAKIEIARDIARRHAWDSLGKRKFLMFGYYAQQWMSLNDLCEKQQRNPWGSLVKLAWKAEVLEQAEADLTEDCKSLATSS